MRKYAILIMAIGMLLALAIPAGAVKPDKPGPPGDPGDDPVLAGTTCADMDDNSYLKGGADLGSFGLALTAATQTKACFDVSNVRESGSWTVDFDVKSGNLRELIVSVRDSAAPGDGCDEARLRPSEATGTISLNPNAADTVNACGTEYAEIVDGEYFDQATDDRSPLAFIVWTRGSKDLVVDFMVDYPNVTP